MTHESISSAQELPQGSHSKRKGLLRTARFVAHAIQVRLRFIVILLAAFLVASQWDTLRNYWDRFARPVPLGRDPGRIVSPSTEYFCPMDPVVVSMRPAKCDICNMALVRRKVGEAAVLPSGVLARMQLSPYRLQLAGIQTTPAEYRSVTRDVLLVGIVRDDGQIECRLARHDRPFVEAGLPAVVDAGQGLELQARVAAVEADSGGLHARALIQTEQPLPRTGSQVYTRISRLMADIEPYRSLPADPPARQQGDLLALYVCPEHADVREVKPGRCPIDRRYNLERMALLENQRVGWWCPMHPGTAFRSPAESCGECGGMKPVPRVITYRPRGMVLTVPQSAVVETGKRVIVFVERGPGMFDSIELAVGPRCDGMYPVAGGLEPGQRVASQGAFLIDAETRLNPALAANYFGAARAARAPQPGPNRDDAGAGRDAGEDLDAERREICPVTGKVLGSMGPPVTVTVDGHEFRLCCEGCESRVRETPDIYRTRPVRIKGEQPRPRRESTE